MHRLSGGLQDHLSAGYEWPGAMECEYVLKYKS